MNWYKRVIYILVLAIFVIILMWMIVGEKKTSSEYDRWAQKSRKEIEKLQLEKYELQQELRELERDYMARMEEKSYAVLCFKQMDSNLVDVVYPLMSEYEYKGVFIVDDMNQLGVNNNLTQEEYQMLLDEGWQAVTTAEMEEYVKALGLDVAAIQEREAVVQEKLINTIDSGGSQLITTRYVDKSLQDIDVDCSVHRYTNLLEWLHQNERLVAVKTFSELQVHFDEWESVKEQTRKEWESVEQDIQAKITELERMIKNAGTKQ